ncbi:MAG: DUF2228 domain-containing protein [Myxococcota bacterium]|nr:DUF2228 domain-containing protein [Myxococcota bacterium]
MPTALFSQILQSLLGFEVELEQSEEGPVLVHGGLRLILSEPSCIFEGDEDADLSPLMPVMLQVPVMLRLHALLPEWTRQFQRDSGETVVVSCYPPDGKSGFDPSLGLCGELSIGLLNSQRELVDVASREGLLVPIALLNSEEWPEHLLAWRGRTEAALQGASCLEILEAWVFSGEPELEDEGWTAFVDALGLEAVESWALSAVDLVEQRAADVQAEFSRIYELPAPSDWGVFVALVFALGKLPSDPPKAFWESTSPWSRGALWLEMGLGMRPVGLSQWFAQSPLRLESIADETTGAPLDPRLDYRYRCDAPNFVTFASGDSDGSHWGFWYDSAEYSPVIAHNWARDSAETELVADSLSELLQSQLAQRLEEWQGSPEEPFALAGARSAKVCAMAWEAVLAAKGECAEPALPPWPRSHASPIGSPRLALPPEAGQLPASVPGCGHDRGRPPADALRADLALARRALAGGAPAHAYALGLYLHWLDDDELRDEAHRLLADAYVALGMEPMAELLDLHVQHRDLSHVAVLRWPEELEG